MTVQNVAPLVQYTGNGAQTSFAFNFRSDDVLWINVDFTDNLSGVNLNIGQDGNPGGTVDYSVAPPDGQIINIERDVPITQETDYTRYDPFDSEASEDAYDKLTMIIQDLLAEIAGLELTINSNFAWQFISFNGDRTLAGVDAYKMLRSIDDGGTQEVTVPPNIDVNFAKGTQVSFLQKGTSVLSFTPGAAVSIEAPGQLEVAKQWGTVTLVQEEIDNWVLLGNITP
jgi:hypothetical protein